MIANERCVDTNDYEASRFAGCVAINKKVRVLDTNNARAATISIRNDGIGDECIDCLPILFRFGPDSWFTVVPIDVDHAWVATDWAVFHVGLPGSTGWIQRDHDFFSATVANVRSLGIHGTFNPLIPELYNSGTL